MAPSCERPTAAAKAPLRLIYGENDRILPDIAKTMARIQESHPGAELTALPNCGHFLQEDDRVEHRVPVSRVESSLAPTPP
jgi:pimeloyl-ACP methyl ester carboxylesterase